MGISGKKLGASFVTGLCARGTCTNEPAPKSKYCRRCNTSRKSREEIRTKNTFNRKSMAEILKNTETNLYAIVAGNCAVKFGLAKNVETRLSELQVGNYQQLRLAASIGCTWDLEAMAHKHLAESWIRGEWHHFDDRAKALILRMRTGDLFQLRRLLGDPRLQDL